MTPHRSFLVLGLGFGALFVLATPPFAPPDELRHFLRAYLVSEGRFAVPGQAPGYSASIPTSLARLEPSPSQSATGPLGQLHLKAFRSQWSEPLEPERRQGVGSLSLYSPLVYAPQAAAIAFGRALGGSALALLYLGRLANLAAWALLSALAIRIAPARGWAFALLFLTPMAVFQAASLSADNPTNAIALLFVASCLRAAFGPGAAFERREAGAIVAAGLALGLAKPGYWALGALVLLIPGRRFDTSARRWQYSAAVLAAVLLPSIFWQLSVEAAQPYPLTLDADARGQLEGVLSAPFAFLQRAVTTFGMQAGVYLRTLVGTLGQLDIQLPELVYFAYPALLLAAAATDPRDPPALTPLRRLALVALFACVSLGVLTLAYLGWNPVGERWIHGVQGRYFLPAMPLLLFALPAVRAVPERTRSWGAVLCSTATLSTALYATVRHYYAS